MNFHTPLGHMSDRQVWARTPRPEAQQRFGRRPAARKPAKPVAPMDIRGVENYGSIQEESPDRQARLVRRDG